MITPKTVGSIVALIALAGGILGRVDPLYCLYRAGIAFVLGWIAAQVWYAVITIQGNSNNKQSE